MNCASCVGRVETTFQTVDGVQDVAVKLAAETATFVINSPEQVTDVSEALAAIWEGYSFSTGLEGNWVCMALGILAHFSVSMLTHSIYENEFGFRAPTDVSDSLSKNTHESPVQIEFALAPDTLGSICSISHHD